MLVYILASTLVLVYGVYRWRNRKIFQLEGILGTDPGSLPFIGIAYKCIGNGEVLAKGVQTTGINVLNNQGIMTVTALHAFFVVIADPILANYVSKTCLEKDDVMKMCLKPVWGNCNFLADVPIWRVRRKNLMTPFSPRNLKQFVKVFAEQSEILAVRLRPSLGQSVALFDELIKYSMETLCQTTLGIELDLQNRPGHPFTKNLEKLTELTGGRALKPWLHIDCLFKLFPSYRQTKKLTESNNQFVDEIIKIAKQKNESDSNKTQDGDEIKSLLEQFLELAEKEEGYSDQELREETMFVTVAGIDTTAIASGFVFAMLARHPHVQEKVYSELAEVFKNDEPVIPEHLSRMKYLDAVIKETLRLFPPVPVVTRQTDKHCELPSGVVLPEGTGIGIHLWAINRHPDYWGPDADEFRPERFLETSPKHPAQFSAFSLGPRNCIGYKYALMSMQTLFATLLRRYRFLPVMSTNGEVDKLRLTYGITLSDADNFRVILQPRKSDMK